MAEEPTPVLLESSSRTGVLTRAGLAHRTRQTLGSGRDYAIVVLFVGLFITLSIGSDVFLTKANLLNVLDQSAAIGIMACGGTLVIIAGGFDLSVGSIYAAAGVLAAYMTQHVGAPTAWLLGFALGAALGIINGLLTTAGRINAFIATLASGLVIMGMTQALTGGMLITPSGEDFSKLGTGMFLGVKYTIWIFLGFALVLGIVLARGVFGRAVYASGGNAEAARLAGIRVGVIRTATFAISGLSAGIAGVLVASRSSTGQSDSGTNIALPVIAAIVIGGTSIWGGEGAIWRTVLGVLLLTLIGNGFNLLSVTPDYQLAVQGGIMLLAVGFDAWARRRV